MRELRLACLSLLLLLALGIVPVKGGTSTSGRAKISLLADIYRFNLSFSQATAVSGPQWTKNRGLGLGDQNYSILGALSCTPGQSAQYENPILWECGVLKPLNDTLQQLAKNCTAGDIPKFINGVWRCSPDINNCPLLLPSSECPVGSVFGWGLFEGTLGYVCKQDQDTLAHLTCPANDIPKWNSTLESFVCAVDLNTDTLRSLTCGNGDTPTYNSTWVCDEPCADTLRDLNCAPGQLAVKTSSNGWACGADQNYDLCAELPSLCKNGQALGTTADGSALACLVDKGQLLCPNNEWPVYSSATSTWGCGIDQDTNTLAHVLCATGQVLKWNSTAQTFECGVDNDDFRTFTCSSSQQGYTIKKLAGQSTFACSPDLKHDTLADVNTTQCIALRAGGGNPVLGYEQNSWQCVDDCDTLAGLSCSSGSVVRWDQALNEWHCGVHQQDTLYYLSCGQGDVAQWNRTQSAWVCREWGDTLSSLHCQNGQLPKFSAANHAWQCGNDSNHDVLLQLHCFNGATIKFSLATGNTLGWVCAIDNNDDTLRELGGPGGCPNGDVPVFETAGQQWVCGPPVVNTDTLRDLHCTPGEIPKAGDNGTWVCGTDLTCRTVSVETSNNPSLLVTSGKPLLINSFLNPVTDVLLDWGGRVLVPPIMAFDGYIIGMSGSLTKTGLAQGSNITFTVTINSVPQTGKGYLASLGVDPSAVDNLVDTPTLARNLQVFAAPIPFYAGDSIGYQISTNPIFAVGANNEADCLGTLFVTSIIT